MILALSKSIIIFIYRKYFIMDDIFARTPKTGVIYVMSKASELGFYYGNKDWSNLGQGAPEVGFIGEPNDRLKELKFIESDYEYAPVGGMKELRSAVANLYNLRYRGSKKSQYTSDNVSICAGGRLALTRVVATLNNINLGHFLPDYTAYEELLGIFNRFVSIPISNSRLNEFKPSAIEIKEAVLNLGLGGILFSNPCNPTGRILTQEELDNVISSCIKLECAVIIDEFYSHYIYEGADNASLSAAHSIKDVDKEPVIIIDGLTKNWRYPGVRLAWVVGPKSVIANINSAGSFLDGGATHIIQRAAIKLLKQNESESEKNTIRKTFREKRDYMCDRLRHIGFELNVSPEGAFYCFPSLVNLPKPLQDSMFLFKALLNKKVICVPGSFFDVNPGHRRKNIHARLNNYIRFSYGPSIEEIMLGLDKVEDLVLSYK